MPQEPPWPARPHATRARVVSGTGRPGHRRMPRHNIDWKSNSRGPWAGCIWCTRACTAGRYWHVRSHMQGARGVLVDSNAGDGWCAVILKARAHRPWRAGGACAGASPRAPAGNCGPTWVLAMHTRNRPAAQASCQSYRRGGRALGRRARHPAHFPAKRIYIYYIYICTYISAHAHFPYNRTGWHHERMRYMFRALAGYTSHTVSILP